MSEQKQEKETKKENNAESAKVQSSAGPKDAESPVSSAVQEDAKKSESPTPSAPKSQSPKATAPPTITMRLNGRALKTSLDLAFLKKTHPNFSVGDTIRVNVRIREGDKQRIQVYEGIVIALRGEGNGRSFIVRRVSHEVGVERIFPYYSPAIQSIEVVRRGRVRRARLYYLRHKSGKEGRIQESFSHLSEKVGTEAKEQVIETDIEEGAGSPIDEKGTAAKSKEGSTKASKKTAKKLSKQGSRKIIKISKTAARKMTKKAKATTTKDSSKDSSKVSEKSIGKKLTSKKKSKVKNKIAKKVAKKSAKKAGKKKKK